MGDLLVMVQHGRNLATQRACGCTGKDVTWRRTALKLMSIPPRSSTGSGAMRAAVPCLCVGSPVGSATSWRRTSTTRTSFEKNIFDGNYHSVLGDRVKKLNKPFREIVVYDTTQVFPEFILYYRRLFKGDRSS